MEQRAIMLNNYGGNENNGNYDTAKLCRENGKNFVVCLWVKINKDKYNNT